MTKFPEVLIIRYYELEWIYVSYSDDLSEENINKIHEVLENEKNIKNWLEYYEVIVKWKGIKKEV